MDRNDFIKLVNKGAITRTGLVEKAEDLKVEDLAAKGIVTKTGVADKITDGSFLDKTPAEKPSETPADQPVVKIAPALTSTMVDTMKVGDTVEFTATTVANDYVGTAVYSTIDFGATNISEYLTVEYLEVKDNKYYPLPMADGKFVFGAGAGFPCADATSTFRVTAIKSRKKAFTITSQLIAVEGNKVLAEVKSTLTLTAE